MAAAKAFSSRFFSPDYRSLDGYIVDVDAATTGGLRSDFDKRRDTLRSLLTPAHSTASGRILAGAVRQFTPTTATVLLAADQQVTSTSTGGKPTTQRYRVAEGLRLVNGRWLVGSLDPLSGISYGTGCPDATASQQVQDVLEASCSDLTTLYSYDYRSIDADIARQEHVSTGTVHDQIVSDTGPVLRQKAPQTKAQVVAQPVTAAVERQSGDSATVLVFLDQAVRTTLLAQPRLDRQRLEVTMQRVDGRWLVSDVTAL